MSLNRNRLVAEFFVVMLGVLAALGVDTIVGAVRDVARAGDYRERLREDLRADVEALRGAWAHDRRTLEYGSVALAVLENDAAPGPPDQQLLALYLAGNLSGAALNTSTWDDLVSTGSLQLIDVDLRAQLASYYRGFLTGPTSWTPPREYRDRVRRTVPPAIVERLDHAACIFSGMDEKPSPTPVSCATRVDPDEAERIITHLRSEPGLAGDLILRMSEVRTIAQQLDNFAQRAELLVARLDQ